MPRSSNNNGPVSKESLPIPSLKSSRRQVSIGSFNALPNGSELTKALAAVSNSPPLPSVPLDGDAQWEKDEEHDVVSPTTVDLATPLTPGFPISPDPFNRRPGFPGKPQGDLTLVTDTGSKGPAETGSPVSPPPRMSSRFSADSVNSDDGQLRSGSRNDRTGSMMSVKGIRSLWRKSGNSKNIPLMSPGINGQQVPPTPPPFIDAGFTPPLPSPAGGYFSPISMGPSPLQKAAAPTPDSGNASRMAPSTTHRRSESGLDPFHFDQDSRYPVHKMPSPSQAFTDQVPPTDSIATSPPPPPMSAGGKKGILKAWSSKGSSMKRASAEVINAGRTSTSSPQPPPSAFGSITAGKKGKRPSISGIIGGGGHSKQSSKASISSVGTNSKHTYPNNSLSGTSHASSHQGAHSTTEPPFNLVPASQPIASGRSSHEAVPGHKASPSGSTNEPRKSTTTPPPHGAVAIAAAVAASRERRGTSYIGPADNRI